MTRRIALMLLAMTVLFWMAGCSDKASEPTGTQGANVEDELGGYTATAEEPGFGDEALLAADESGVEYDDPILAEPSADSVISDVEAGLFHLRVLWGRLDYDSTVVAVTDWTGSLTVGRGVEVIRRVIRFEPGQDYIQPRTARNIIEWVSQTTVHNDGLAVDIFIPRAVPAYDTSLVITDDGAGNLDTTIVVDTLLPELVTVKFETGPYSREFTLDELVKLDTVVQLEDGNAVAFQAFQLTRIPCPRGFVAGTWAFDSDTAGVFCGIWMSRHGFVEGYVKGSFGKDDQGGNIFYGKWITATGEFEGLLKGTYGFHANHHAADRARVRAGGWIKGAIYSADLTEIGELKGSWGQGPRAKRIHYFQARWKLHCSGVISDDDGFDDHKIDCGDYKGGPGQ